jgi:hypothetical protein
MIRKKPFIATKKVIINAKFIFIIIASIISFYLIFIKKIKNINNKDNIKNNRNFKIIAITYGNQYYQRQIKNNRKSALEIGKVDEHYAFGPQDIDQDFREKNKEILSGRKGNGYYLWKPYFILKTFKEKLKEGDYLIYTDSAMLYMNSTYQIIDFLKEKNAEMWMYRLTLFEKKYSKRDAFVLLGVDTPFYSETYQYMAGIQVYKKSKYTEKFIEQLLYYSQDKRIITDQSNTQGLNNYPGFRANRHDQTVLSLLIKKYGEANSGKSNISLKEFFKRKKIVMPNIFCIYRRRNFKNFDDLWNKCLKILKYQKNIFT